MSPNAPALCSRSSIATTVHSPPCAALLPRRYHWHCKFAAQCAHVQHAPRITHWTAVAQQAHSGRVAAVLPVAPGRSDDTFLVKLRQERIADALKQFENICLLGGHPSNTSCQRFIAGTPSAGQKPGGLRVFFIIVHTLAGEDAWARAAMRHRGLSTPQRRLRAPPCRPLQAAEVPGSMAGVCSH
jgi:hypothetical protein